MEKKQLQNIIIVIVIIIIVIQISHRNGLICDRQYRFLMFLFGCVPARLFIIYMAGQKITSLTTIISIGFLHEYLTFDAGKTPTGAFGGEIYWNNYRLLSSILYGTYTILQLNNYDRAWLLLLMDLGFGIFSAFSHYL